MNVIEISGLRKEYRSLRGRRTTALDGLDLAVPAGGVFGFLGPNGSGKTTTIRCLLGLVRPTAGASSIFGADSQRALPDVIERVGSIVETPMFFPRFSGYRNLAMLARLYRLPLGRVDAVLEKVGLATRARHLVRTYSLGMKQRLGIAAALLKDPELLILDEPANGLDPAGIKEVRELLRELGQEGRTVFVSSHILSEVAQTCDRVAILSRGRCVAAGAVSDVLAARQASGVIVRVDEIDRARDVLAAANVHATVADGELKVDVPPRDAARVTRILAAADLYLSELRPHEVDLETVFLELTADPAAEIAP